MTNANRMNPFGLTHRECEVVDALVRHGSPKAAAFELGISPKAINTTLRLAGKKMDATTHVLIAVKWVRNRLDVAAIHGARPRATSVFTLAQSGQSQEQATP